MNNTDQAYRETVYAALGFIYTEIYKNNLRIAVLLAELRVLHLLCSDAEYRLHNAEHCAQRKTLSRKRCKFITQIEQLNEKIDYEYHVHHCIKRFYAKEIIKLMSCDHTREKNLKTLSA